MNNIDKDVLKEINTKDFIRLRNQRVYELLKDSSADVVNETKKIVIENEILNSNDDNIVGDIELLTCTIPQNITTIEKIRWYYHGLGNLFCYDYRVIDNIDFAKNKSVDINNYVGRYQTCVQISKVFCDLINTLDNVSARVIERKSNNIRAVRGENHVAVEATIKDEKSEVRVYLFDLTLDLYRIQAGLKTMHFGFESGENGQYDIIPQIDNYQMDKKLNLLFNEYTNKMISEIKDILKNVDYSNMDEREIIEYRIMQMSPLIRTFKGYHEGKLYIEMLFDELLGTDYKKFNIFSIKGKNMNLKSCYEVIIGSYKKWLLYSNKIGLMSIDGEKLKNMLNNGWNTNSKTLVDELDGKKLSL